MRYRAIIGILALAASPSLAQVTVHDPWVRATVPEQKTTGGFMTLTSPTDARLVSVSSPIAGLTEVHQMTMENGVMRMRAVSSIEIPAGKQVQLKPGGFHIMLMNLKRQVKEGETVPITLVIEEKGGKRVPIEVKAPVRPLNTPANGDHDQHNH